MIKLVLDSCVALDKEYLDKNDIRVAHFNLLIGEEYGRHKEIYYRKKDVYLCHRECLVRDSSCLCTQLFQYA